MRSVLTRSLAILLVAAPLAGCFTTIAFKEQPRLECPEPPPPPCLPQKFDEITIDTSSAQKAFSSHYLKISRVQGLSSGADEYSVAFPSGTRGATGLATLREGRNREDAIMRVSFSAPDKATINGQVQVRDVQGSVGGSALGVRRDTILFAARAAGNVMGDYDLFAGAYDDYAILGGKRRPISSVIYWDAQPALAPDGRTLYFASDRRGSIGGTDIYVTRMGADGRWSVPENVGLGVNTPCDELGPFVSGDGAWLYFSSAGHATVGGYDLFRAPIRGGQVGTAQNLGRPVNTPADELFPSAPPNASPDTLLYYCSNQPGSDLFDIYVLHRLPRKGAAVTTAAARTVTLKGTVRNSIGRPVDSAVVTIEERDPPGRRDSTVTSKDGQFRFEVEEGRRYEVITGSDSSLYVREEIRIPVTDKDGIVTHDITLSDTITFRVNFPFNNDSDPYEFTLNEQGLPSDLRWVDMIDRAAVFLKRFNDARGLRFEIVGHTDPVGSDPFNLGLGQRRAEFIRRELIRRGVNASMLSVFTRGESQPLPQSEGEPEQQYHARLRRVELIRKK